jgi:hypothetical protein
MVILKNKNKKCVHTDRNEIRWIKKAYTLHYIYPSYQNNLFNYEYLLVFVNFNSV